MTPIDVQQLEPRDRALQEEWTRVTDEPHIRGVGAARLAAEDTVWYVTSPVAEHIRQQPLQSQLHDAITAALEGVPGVREAFQEDREVWFVEGDASGETLIRAVATALDGLASLIRAAHAAL